MNFFPNHVNWRAFFYTMDFENQVYAQNYTWVILLARL